MSISPELQAKIDALPYEDLKADILHTLNGPGKKRATDEAIFETAVSGYMEGMAYHARLRKWRDDEVLAFVDYFKQEMPQGYAEFLRQEREDHQIDGDLAWEVHLLAERWLPDIDPGDRGELFSKLRDHVQAHLI
jgi:hypothetical protein